MRDFNTALPTWECSDLPPSLGKKFEFDSYRTTRRFLDDLAKLSAEASRYPNLSFGKNYVSITIDAHGEPLDDGVVLFAQEIDKLGATSETQNVAPLHSCH